MKTIIPGNKWSFTTLVKEHDTSKLNIPETKETIEAEKISKWLSHVKQNMQNGDVVLVQSGKAWYHQSVTK